MYAPRSWCELYKKPGTRVVKIAAKLAASAPPYRCCSPDYLKFGKLIFSFIG